MADQCRGLVTGDPGQVLVAADYFGAAGRVLDQGFALEDAAEWDIRRAGARLRPFGIRPRRLAYPSRPASGWGALTPTEVKIAGLVAGGRSNPDIAAELFLSRNTVQTHVSRILAKLGARSRVEIAAEALRHPSSADRATA
jgi:DNA-binding CsgD family transcriptional regulator